jgi:murein DD-endopeptidase MepM/ murein hydrolase activator NlpD
MIDRPDSLARSLLLALFCLALLGGCGIYSKHGYGKVVRSNLPADQVTELELPPNAPTISQRFRPEGVSSKSEHKGFDILVPSGTPVLAAADGVVSRAETSIYWGRVVDVDHAAIAAGHRIQTRYYHLSERLVEVGDQVRRGQAVGYSGQSGMAGIYPHLHFEVYRLNDATPPVATVFLDPQLFWVDGPGKITCFDRRRDWARQPVALTYPAPCRDVPW